MVSARIGATLPQCQAARIIIRHPFNPAPHPQHHWRLALSNDLAYDENPAAAVGTRTATSASVRTEKRTVDRRILVDDDWRFVGPPSAICSRWPVAYRPVPPQSAAPVRVPPSSTAARSTRVIRAGDPSGCTIILADLAICRLSPAGTSSFQAARATPAGRIAQRAAVCSACDRRHSLQIHLKPRSKHLRQNLKMC